MRICLNCNSELKRYDQKKFCGRSCSASFNNKKRNLSDETKTKIRTAIQNKIKKEGTWGAVTLERRSTKCVECLDTFYSTYRKTCSEQCYKKYKQRFAKKWYPGGYRKGSGRGKHGWFDGIYFDSTYELAYYIYCKAHNKDIKRCEEKFEYINSKGEKRYYHPDFRVNGKLIEIKGFITLDVELKLKVIKEPIDLLLKEDLAEVFEFVEKQTGLKIKNLHKLYSTPDGARTRKSSP